MYDEHEFAPIVFTQTLSFAQNKAMNLKNQLIYFICSAVSVLLLSACYGPKGGCLDPNAVNFDVSADKDSNCIYPSLILSIAHLYDTNGLKIDSLYTNQLGQKYRFKEVSFYLSNFKIVSGLQEYTTQDTFHAYKRISPSANDSTFISPLSDIGLVRRSVVSLNLGTFREIGNFDGLKFDFGLNAELRTILPGSVRLGSPLRPQNEMLYDSAAHEHRFGRFVIERIDGLSGGSMLDTVYLRGAEYALGENIYTQNVPLKQEAGYNFQVKLSIDYSKWLSQINLTNTLNDKKTELAKSIMTSFSVSQ
jgi:hypothetical protein